jgi:hypothetical protein
MGRFSALASLGRPSARRAAAALREDVPGLASTWVGRKREVRRPLPLEASAASPVAILCDPDIAAEIASWPIGRLARRQMIFAAAIAGRGRGRIPKALYTEGARLNRADRLLCWLRSTPPDPRQLSLPTTWLGRRQAADDWASLLRWRNFD